MARGRSENVAILEQLETGIW